jgi:predicted transcriptional regulator
VVNARIDSDTLARLDELANETQRTRSFLISQAITDFVEREYAFLSAVKEGEADVQAGRTLSHEQALKWAKDLKAGRVLDAPPHAPAKRRRA